MRSRAAADFQLPVKSGYVMHGVNVTVESDQPRLIGLLQRRLAAFSSQGEHARKPELRFEFRTTERGAVVERMPALQRMIYAVAGTEFRYDDVYDVVFAARGDRVIGVCSARLGQVRFELAPDMAADIDLYSELSFTVFLVELLKRQGRFSLHAAGISVGDTGILLAGPSGAGKSTIAVALLQSLGGRAGFLGDDMLFVRSDARGIRILGWPEPIDVGEWTQRTLPGLAPRMEVMATGRRKGSIAFSEVGAAPLSLDAGPEVIVFPRVTGRTRSTLTSMSEDEALVELAPNVLLTEAISSKAHLAALAALARQCRCYRLEAGDDIERVPGLVLGLI
jgi:hypothetical protein